MRTRILIVVSLILFAPILVFPYASGQKRQRGNTHPQPTPTPLDFSVLPSQRGSDELLRGLKGVSISVQVLAKDDEMSSMWTTQVRNDGELRLRRASIPILEANEPTLAITILTYESSGGNFTATVLVNLRERALLQRDHTKTLTASTWEQVGVYAFGKENFRYLREQIQDTVDSFANAYLKANPK